MSLFLLSEIASGSADEWPYHFQRDRGTASFRFLESWAQGAAERSHDQVQRGLPVYRRYFERGSEIERLAASVLLGKFQHEAGTRIELESRFAAEQNAEIQASLLLAFAIDSDLPLAAATRTAAHHLLLASEPPVRLATALVLSAYRSPETEAAVLAILADVICKPDDYTDSDAFDAWGLNEFSEAGKALARFGPDTAHATLQKRWDDAPFLITELIFFWTLMGTAFEHEPFCEKPLTPLQRRILESLAASDLFWESPIHLYLAVDYRLPDTQDGLRNFLSSRG